MANPALNAVYRESVKSPNAVAEVLTLRGVVNKTFTMLGVVAAVALATAAVLPVNLLLPVSIGASFLGLILAMVLIFNKAASPAGYVAYAVVEGVFIGGFSAYMNLLYPNVVLTAVAATFFAAGAVFAMWKTGVIKVGDGFMKTLMVALWGYLALSLINVFVAVFTGWNAYFTEMGWLFALIGVVLASLSLAADFQMISKAVSARVGKEYEWQYGFGLTVTLVWLYVEFLRLFGLLRD